MYTANNALSNVTTYDPLIDLFFRAVRGISENKLNIFIDNAFKYNPSATICILFYIRDCRGGKGERRIFINALRYLFDSNLMVDSTPLLHLIPQYGTYKDLLLCTLDTPCESAGINLYAYTLANDMFKYAKGKSNITLAAKWAPSPHQSLHKKYPHVIKELINGYNHYAPQFNLSRINLSKYRKNVLVPLRAKLNIVETPICDNNLSHIDYNTVPAKAISKYKSIFSQGDSKRFKKYLNDVSTGKLLMKVNTIYSYEILKNIDATSELQWKQLVSQIDKISTNTLTVIDTSGSMTTNLAHTRSS
jgi:hypothetical protein